MHSVYTTARFELPSLETTRIYLTGHMECSPVSLSLKGKYSDQHQLLSDGEGIVAITIETLYIPSLGPQGHRLPPDVSSWTSTTCCSLIQPFHAAAGKSLRGAEDSSDHGLTYSYDEWAPSVLSWLPRHPIRPTRDAICGYRLATVGESFTDLDGVLGGLANMEHQTLRILDFTPGHVNRARYIEARGRTPLQFSSSLNILPLYSEENTQNGSDLDRSPTPYERVVVTKSAPTTEPAVFERKTERYATEAPYILLTRRISINPSSTSFICQISHNAMLLTQVSPSDSY
jgi:hypothetical protein